MSGARSHSMNLAGRVSCIPIAAALGSWGTNGVLPTAAFAACPQLRQGCVELGIAGSLLHVEETTRADVMLRGGTFAALGRGRLGGEMEMGYGHTSELDVLDLLWNVSWQMPLGAGTVWPGIAVSAGVRQEWLGSFREDRYPVGLHLGVRFLLGDRAGVRLEYRYDRFLDDPVANFDEQRLVFGLSLLLRNRCLP